MTATAHSSKSAASQASGTPIVWIDHQWLTRETATISVYDHGLLYGDGVFEGVRIYGGKAFKLIDHIDRLLRLGTGDLPHRADVEGGIGRRDGTRRCSAPVWSKGPSAISSPRGVR